MTNRALVIGCGGTIGGAWTIAALSALADAIGAAPGDFDLLQGTSAGAELSTMFAGGVRLDDLIAMQQGRATDSRLRAHLDATPSSVPPLPLPRTLNPRLLRSGSGLAALTGIAPTGRGNADWLQRLADAFPASPAIPNPRVRMVAYDIDRGTRVALGAPSAPKCTAGEALRASWAIPGWLPPVIIDGRRHVDGGAASTASVDLIDRGDADEIYVVAPMASIAGQRVPGIGGVVEDRFLRRPMSAGLIREISAARQEGIRVIAITPTTADLAGLGPNFMARNKRVEAFESALRTTPATVRAALARSQEN